MMLPATLNAKPSSQKMSSSTIRVQSIRFSSRDATRPPLEVGATPGPSVLRPRPDGLDAPRRVGAQRGRTRRLPGAGDEGAHRGNRSRDPIFERAVEALEQRIEVTV